MGDTGLELPGERGIVTNNDGEAYDGVSDGCPGPVGGRAAQGAAQGAALPDADPDLARIVAAWPELDFETRQRVLVLVGSVAGDTITETPAGDPGKAGSGGGVAAGAWA